MSELLGYARVSTTDQTLDLQSDAPSAAGCSRIWTETASGATTARPQLDDLFSHLQAGDTLVVWRLDRLGRSLPHLLQVVTDLEDRGIGFRSVTESIDTTTTAGGKLIFSIFGALAEFERNLIRERTSAGLTAARARGRIGGRPPKMTTKKIKQAKLMRDNGMSQTEIAEILGVGRTTLYRHLK
ncbi:recombinase family protein [Rhodococcus coprophilus]|uniref:recombinase family protein n=1 Tax=Rhodococcus coprophilus TaxID=38310 RepID=UPI000934ABC1|nr:recombinase family protein [Rhodococcus coprophilus]MBM7460785.1 DNA invertase Pin-like site-specific DNA recombinase [Rhodococcus coprophilus]